MKNNFFKHILLMVVSTSTIISCTKNLDTQNSTEVNASDVYATPAGYKQSLAKVYGSFALTGSDAGSSDIAGIDAGNSDFFRMFWNMQELTTDEAVTAGHDPNLDAGLQDLHLMSWSASNKIPTGLYYRSLYQIALVNDFLRQSTDVKLAERGITGTDAANINEYKLEVRFLRAYQYWVLMDLFGNPPFATEADAVGANLPKQIGRPALFNFIESELKDIETGIIAAKQNEYGRVDKATVQALLARLYLNAEVYIGAKKYTEAIAYSSKVINAGYSLIDNYKDLMLADNNTNTSENIFTITYDGKKTQGYGGGTFLTHGAVGGTIMVASDFGVNGGWSQLRTTKNIVNLYVDLTFNSDKRAQFFTSGQKVEINDLLDFADGYAVTKYKNITKTGSSGSDPTFCDIDIPIFRVAEMYLIYGEAVARGGTGGDANTALTYANLLRKRAYGTAQGNATLADMSDLQYFINERARELFWEGFRRTDLIRYNQFVGNTYLWPWKGGLKNGANVDDFRKLYAIPTKDLSVNPNLKQNEGYN
jgi:starch-binding outer membrane protein, SusD/RagB family